MILNPLNCVYITTRCSPRLLCTLYKTLNTLTASDFTYSDVTPVVFLCQCPVLFCKVLFQSTSLQVFTTVFSLTAANERQVREISVRKCVNWISRSVVPLPVHGAQGDGPQIRAETGQLGNVVGHLQQHMTQKSSLKAHFYNQVHHFYYGTCGITHLPSWHALSVFVEIVDVGAEGLEVRDDKLLPEGLSQQDDVALDTPETGERDLVRTRESCFCRLWACFSSLQHFIH